MHIANLAVWCIMNNCINVNFCMLLDNFETHEAKVFFQRHYSEIYYICHDYFSVVEVTLRQKGNYIHCDRQIKYYKQCWKMSGSARNITLQEIFLHLAVFLSPYALECHIIYLLFTKAFCKSRLSSAKIEVYHNVRHHMFSAIYTCWKFYI